MVSKELVMYGCDINEFKASVRNGLAYEFTGSGIIVCGLMSDAQEAMSFGDTESARQYLNRAKALMWDTINGTLTLTKLPERK
jgi:hypothetical protein